MRRLLSLAAAGVLATALVASLHAQIWYPAPRGTTGSTCAADTWDPAKKDASITLSNGNRTAIGTTAAWRSVYGLTGHSTGKYYLRIQGTTFSVSNWMGGLGDGSATTSSYPGSTSHGVSSQFNNSRGIWVGGSSVSTTSASLNAAGDYVVIAVDMGAAKYWTTTQSCINLVGACSGGVFWNNSSSSANFPTNGGNGVAYTATGTLYPAFGTISAGSDSGTIDTTTVVSDASLAGFSLFCN